MSSGNGIDGPAHFAFGSLSTEAAGFAARPNSASPRKLTSGPSEKLVATGQISELVGPLFHRLINPRQWQYRLSWFRALVVVI